MKKNSSSLCNIVKCVLVAVILSGILCSLLILPAAADSPATFIMTWVEKTNGPVEKLGGQNIYGGTLYLPEIIPEPPYVTDNPANKGSYAGPCPIGGTAPQLRQTGLSTGALCRGACGINCPEERCRPVADVKKAAGEGVCTYTNVVSCNSHEGCRDHDACYDYCSEVQKESSLAFGSCHGVCNSRCYRDYGLGNCIIWADLPGSASSTLGLMTDVVTAPLTDKYLIFSDEPVFTPDSQKVTPTVTVNANTAYQWAILDSMQYSSGCSSSTYYADSRCNGAGWDGTCGQVPSKCVDTSGYRNGLRREFSYRVVSQIDGNRNTYTVPHVDGWAITYDYAGNIVTAFRWKNGVQSDYCYGVGSRDDVPWDGIGGRDLHLDCEGPDGKSYTRESVSLGDP